MSCQSPRITILVSMQLKHEKPCNNSRAYLCFSKAFFVLPYCNHITNYKKDANRSKSVLFKFLRILEKFHFSISILKLFHFTFTSRSRFPVIYISFLDLKAFVFHLHFSKRVNGIFIISLCTSREKWKIFFLHFSIVQNPLSQDTEILPSWCG